MGKGTWWILGIIVVLAIVWFVFLNVDQTVEAKWLDGETSFELGDVEYSGGLVSTTLAFTNNSVDEVKIEDVFSNCSCTVAVISHGPHTIGPFGMPGHDLDEVGELDWSILPGDDFTVKITFDPAAHGEESIGDNVERKVTIQTDMGNGEIIFMAHII